MPYQGEFDIIKKSINKVEIQGKTSTIEFEDNGAIKSYDDNHSIVFDRENDTLNINEFGDIKFNSGTAGGTNHMIIKQNGNIGIGTTNPAEILEIKGSDATFTPDNYGDIFRIYGTDAHIQVGSDDAGGYGSSLLLTTGLKTWSINSRGTGASQRFSINLTNHANTTPVDALSGNSEYFTIDTSGLVGVKRSSSIRGGIDIDNYGPTQSVTYGWFNSSGGSGTASGNIAYGVYTPHRIAASEFNAISDDRLKEQEEYITDATQTLLKLRPQTYYKKPTFDSDSNVDIWVKESGLIAQEVFYDAPELRYIVTTGINPGEIPDSPPEDYNNNDPSIDPDWSNWGETAANIKYNNLIPYLIKSIQELHARIEVLENN